MLARSDLRGVADLASALAPPPDDPGPVRAVREIIDDVRARGDAALRDLTERFDHCRVDGLRVPSAELTAALDGLSSEVRESLEYADAVIVGSWYKHRGDWRNGPDPMRVKEMVAAANRARL